MVKSSTLLLNPPRFSRKKTHHLDFTVGGEALLPCLRPSRLERATKFAYRQGGASWDRSIGPWLKKPSRKTTKMMFMVG